MKKFLLALLVTLAAVSGYANSFYFAWNGYGLANRYNYGLGSSYGAFYYRGIARGVAVGTLDFYQQFNIYYAKEEGNTIGGKVRINGSYHFFSPMVVMQLSRTGKSQVYCTAGIGQKQDGIEIIHDKWNRTDWSGTPVYDSSMDLSKNANKYVFRLGFGFAQYFPLGGNFHAFISEDAGFMISPIADLATGQFTGLKTNPAHLLQPGFISIRAGIGLITHSKTKLHPCRIYPGEYDIYENQRRN